MRNRIASCLGLMVLSTGLALGQATATGTLLGVVTDASGAAVSGAQVTATNQATNAQRTMKSSSSGEYRFDLLPPGTYSLHVSAAGFSAADTQALSLQVGTSLTANLPLKAGSVATVVEVTTTNSALVDVQKTDSSVSITPEEVEDLPLNGRDFANLAILAPGVKLVDSYDPTKNRYAVYAVNGSSGRNTNTTVNGVDNKDNTVGGAVMQLPLEAVEEFKISTARFSAENGRSEGAAINVITKSGTNKFHGVLYGFFRNDAFQAKNYFDKQSGNPKPSYSRQQYGGSFGGPIRRDKDFGFFAYEGLRERSSLSVDANTFAELTLAKNAGFAAQPETTVPTPFDEKRYNGRIDHVINNNNKVYFSYTAQDNKSLNDQSTNQVDASEGNFTLNDLILANFTVSSVLSTKAVNNFTAGFQYWNNLIDSQTRAPYFTFPDGVSFGTNVNVPQKSSQHKFQFRDDFSYALGKHTLKAGFDFLYEPQVGGFFENNPTPEFDFYEKASDILANTDTKTPMGFKTPGIIQSSTGTSGDPSFNLSPKMVGFYLQDDWRASRKLLLNLGIRYDRDIDTYGIGKQSVSRTHQELVAAAATTAAALPATRINEAGTGYTPSLSYLGGNYTGLPNNDTLDISPRIGFSYDVDGTGKLVIRGGYGIYFGQTFENIPLFMIQQSNAQVFANTYTINCTGPMDPNCKDTVPGTGILLTNYRVGVDPAPVIPPGSFNLAPGSTGRLMNPNFRNPYTQQVNFGAQYALTHASVFEVEYVMARGLHEDKTVNINPTEYFNGKVRPLSAGFAAAGVPILGRFGEEESIGRSYYDGLNASYRAIFGKHANVNINYTYSKALAFEGNPAAFRNTATNPFLGQFRQPDYGLAPNNETNHITAAGTVNLPFRIEISPIFSVGSARPVDLVQSSSDLWGVGSGRSNPHAVLPAGSKFSVANVIAYSQLLTAQAKAANSTLSAFYQSCLTTGACYESNYDRAHGTPYLQLDARVGKTIRFKDRYNVNLFFQGFNLTNRANFGGNYDGNVSDYKTAGTTGLTPLGFINPSSNIIAHSFTGEFGGRFSF